MVPEDGLTRIVPAVGAASVSNDIAFEAVPPSVFSAFVIVTFKVYFTPNSSAPGSNRKADRSEDIDILEALNEPAGVSSH